MSGGEVNEAGAGASAVAFCETLSILLGNPPFTVYALLQIRGKENPEEVVNSFSALCGAHVDEEERVAFSALVNVAFKLARSGNNLKPEELAKDPAIWNRLTLEFGVRAEDVSALTKMSGKGGKEAAAGASPAAFCETLSNLLGNPFFTVYAKAQIPGKETPEEVVKSFSALYQAHLDEEDRRAFSALVNVVFKLACSGSNLKPEDLAKDPAIWNRLTSDFGVRPQDVSALTGKGGKEAAAGASAAAFCETLSNLLGNPLFTVYALSQIPGKETPEEVVKSFSARYQARLDEKDRLAFSALVNVAFKLAGSGSNLKPEDLAKDPAIWNRLTSDFGVRPQDVDLLQGYAESEQTVRESDQCREKAEMEWAHTSFTDYAFFGNAHKHLYEQLKERRMAANIANHYSPYVAVVQASGVGKSRAVMQLSELGVYICYCSLAGQFSSASPPRTGKLADRLSTTHDEYEMVVYFKAWLTVLSDSIREGVTANAWKEQQLPLKNGSPRGDVAQRVLTVWGKLVSEEKPTDYQNTQPRDTQNISICKPEVTKIKSVLPESKDPCICTVLFVFDEARGLQTESINSPFNQVRRALRLFFGEKVFFAVFLDTAARVSNLLPTKRNEDSGRALMLNVRLLEPIYCLPNMAHCQPTPGLTAQAYWDPEKWLLYGRPLWGARWKYDSSVTSLLGLAEQKLLVTTTRGQFGGEKVNVREGITTLSQAIALLSSAAGLSICARSFLAEKLAASHMNLILRVTDVMEQRRVYVGLAAEPILAEAAGNVLSAAKVQEAALKHLDKAYLAGHVTLGPRGEFVTKFILVAAVWKLKHDGWLLRPIPVETYLETLLGTRLQGEYPKNGVVFFNSFVIILRVPTIADLGKAHVSGYAFMYMAENRWPGVDVIIPVWTPEGMTSIVVSAKNVQKAGWLKIESVDKVKSGYTHVPVTKGLSCITLLMSLREPEMKEKMNLVQWSCKDDYIHVSCYGIEENYSFLDKNVKTLLKKLLVTVPDELSDATDEEKGCIKSMLPAQYAVVDEAFSRIPSEGVMSTKRKGNTDQPEGVARKQRKVG